MTAAERWRHAPAAHATRRHRHRHRGIVPALVLVAIAGVLALEGARGWVLVAPLAAAVVVPLAAALSGGRSVRAMDRFAAAVARAISTVLFGLLSVPLVVLPHLYGRMTGVDALDAAGRWTRPPPRRSAARSTWSNDRPRRPLTARRGLVAATALVALSLLWWHLADLRSHPPAVVEGFTIHADAPPPTSDETPTVVLRYPAPAGLKADPARRDKAQAALDDSPWSATGAYQQAQAFLFDERAGTRHENPFEMLDLRSRDINMVDGARRSWTPPPCTCRRLTVWFYGGSTAWGIWQRDDFTIASELARVAYDHGIVIDISNRGMNGFSHWQEAERFAWDLTSGAAPDLVLFYDGVNDMEPAGPTIPPIDQSLDAIWDHSGRSDGPAPDAPPGGRLLAPPENPMLSGAQQDQAIARHYDRVRQMSERTAAAHHIPVRYIWEPSRYTRPFEADEPHYDMATENQVRRLVQVTCDSMAPDVIDACPALATTTGPIFTDDAHHNERGARIIAQFLFEALRPQLESLAATPG